MEGKRPQQKLGHVYQAKMMGSALFDLFGKFGKVAGFQSVRWQPVRTSISWTLPPPRYATLVYVNFKTLFKIKLGTLSRYNAVVKIVAFRTQLTFMHSTCYINILLPTSVS